MKKNTPNASAEAKAALVVLKRLKDDGELSTTEIALFLKMCKINDRPRIFMRKYLRRYFSTKLAHVNSSDELIYLYKGGGL